MRVYYVLASLVAMTCGIIALAVLGWPLYALVAAAAAGSLIYIAAIFFNIEKEEELSDDASATISIGNIRTGYELSKGNGGEVVVLVGGISVPMYVWDTTFRVLSNSGYQVLRYDFPGRGASGKPFITYDNKFYRDHLTALLARLNITRPVHLIGLSFGALVVADFALHHPGLVSRIVLVAPIYRLPYLGFKPLVNFIFIAAPGYIAEKQTRDFKHPGRFPEWKPLYLDQMRRKGFRHSIVSTLFYYKNQQALFCRARETRIPAFVIYGQEERTIGKKDVRRLLDDLKPGVFYSSDSCHLPHLENDVEVNREIVRFLSSPHQ